MSEQAVAEPAWSSCPDCDDYRCNIHGTHAHDCPCPPADEWADSPYLPGAPHPSVEAARRLIEWVESVSPGQALREGLQETPMRFVKALAEYTRGYHVDPASLLKTFEDGAEHYDQMVVVRDMPVYSLCEHHLASFFGTADVGYIPDGKVVGLSKLARVVDAYARRLQVQERLTTQVADLLDKELQPKGVGVVLRCRHLCMEARGVSIAGAKTTTSALRGAVIEKPEARAEFLRLVGPM